MANESKQDVNGEILVTAWVKISDAVQDIKTETLLEILRQRGALPAGEIKKEQKQTGDTDDHTGDAHDIDQFTTEELLDEIELRQQLFGITPYGAIVNFKSMWDVQLYEAYCEAKKRCNPINLLNFLEVVHR